MANMERQYIGIQYHATGIFGYSFRENGTEQFRMNCPVLPEPDILLSGFGRKLWHRKYDGQITLFPGVRRNIAEESGNIQGYFEYTGLYEFRIVTDKGTARVKGFKDGWNVYVGTDLAAAILRLPESERNCFTENGYDMEERFQVNILEKADFSLYPYIMAIPVLGF